MVSMDKEYTTRDGREVKLFTTEARGDYPVVAEVKGPNGWAMALYHKDGAFLYSGTSDADLIEKKKEVVATTARYAVLSETGLVQILCTSYFAATDQCRHWNRVHPTVRHIVVPVTIEVKGEF